MLHIDILRKCELNRFSKSCIYSTRWIFCIFANYRDYRDLERAEKSGFGKELPNTS